MSWLAKNWFKLALILVVPLTAILLVFGFVIYPEQIRQDEKIAEELKTQRAETERLRRQEEEKAKEEERILNLQTCLDESEFQETSSFLSTCGDPNIGRSPQSCFVVFGGTENYDEVLENYKEEFPEELPSYDSVDYLPAEERMSELFEMFDKEKEVVNEFFEVCNCGLEKHRRDELKEEREYRDQQCYALYGD